MTWHEHRVNIRRKASRGRSSKIIQSCEHDRRCVETRCFFHSGNDRVGAQDRNRECLLFQSQSFFFYPKPSNFFCFAVPKRESDKWNVAVFFCIFSCLLVTLSAARPRKHGSSTNPAHGPVPSSSVSFLLRLLIQYSSGVDATETTSNDRRCTLSD